MIGSLRGIVLERSGASEILLEVAGVGYRVSAPTPVLARLSPGEPAFLFTHHQVREDAMLLFGFSTREERDVFEALIGTSGVGPKVALSILSVHTPAAIRRTVLEGDVTALCLVPGVGKRIAQRLILELATRLQVPEAADVLAGGVGSRGEVRAALDALGYGPEEVREALAALEGDGPVELLLREALKILGAGRAPGRRAPAAADPLVSGGSGRA